MTSENLTFSQRMSKLTRDVHDTSEKSVNSRLAVVITSKELYAESISLFWPIYRELESLLEQHKDHKQFKLLYPLLKNLRRAPKFESDMASLLGDQAKADALKARRIQEVDGKEVFSPPELQDYIENLRHISEDNPITLAAYIFAMYGAIMAGGAIIRRMVKGAFMLQSEDGVAMFNMDLTDTGFDNVKAFRNEMKRILDEDMKLSSEDEEAILKESPRVFIRNSALVATVQDTPVFETAWSNCCRNVALVPAVVVAIFAVVMYFTSA